MTHREEALNALSTVEQQLAADEPMTGLRLRLALATVAHAKECVAAIQEVKRVRKPKEATHA